MMKEKTVEEWLDELLQQDVHEIDMREDKQKFLYEQTIPILINRVSKLTGIEPINLVQWSVYSTLHLQDMKWYDILEILQTFYQAKSIAEKKR